MTYAISKNNETFYGEQYDTLEEAFESAKDMYRDGKFYVGETEPPTQPHRLIDVGILLDDLGSGEDTWSLEFSEAWCPSAEQQAELQAEVEKVMEAWVERNNLQPTWFMVPNAKVYFLQNGKVYDERPSPQPLETGEGS